MAYVLLISYVSLALITIKKYYTAGTKYGAEAEKYGFSLDLG